MITKLNLSNKSIVYPIVLHFLLGLVVSIVPTVAFFWQLSVLVYGFFNILDSRNRNEEAALWSAYFAGMEVFLRMTGQTAFWELSKYIVVLFLSMGLLFNTRKLTSIYIIYFLLLIPSILTAVYVDFAQAKDMISFNLSGPLCLAVSGIYFFKKPYSGPQLFTLFRAFVMPVLTMVAYLFLHSPNLSSISFTTASNYSASGGYGPNQVSLILGVCMFTIIIFQFYELSFSGIKWLDYTLIGMILFRAFVTFSRGGIVGAGLAIAVFIILRVLSGFKGKQVFNYFLVSFIAAVGVYFIWTYTNNVTHNALEFRYRGINQQTGKEKEYSTGRIAILTRDLDVFKRNLLLGVGPGKSKYEGLEQGVSGVVAHLEWSRMLSEHGLFGLAALLILFITPIVHIYSIQQISRPLLFAIFVLSLFSMFHAAMRLSIISFMYAWALIIPTSKKKRPMIKASVPQTCLPPGGVAE